MTSILPVELEEGDQLFNLDYNSKYNLIAFSVGKDQISPKVYLYSYTEDSLTKIYECNDCFWDEIRELSWSPDDEYLIFSEYPRIGGWTTLVKYSVENNCTEHIFNYGSEGIIDMEWISDSIVAYWRTSAIRAYQALEPVTSIDIASKRKESPEIEIRAYPNPFNSGVTIFFSLDHFSDYSLKIFNALGELFYENNSAVNLTGGQFYWNGKSNTQKQASSGVYYCVLRNNDRKISKSIKLIMLK